MQSKKFDVIIAGSGLTGMATANALARNGLKIALVSPKNRKSDGRTTALLTHSIDYLKKIDVWGHALPKAAKLSTIRIVDNGKRLIRAPEASFGASEMELEAFGYNILNIDLFVAFEVALQSYRNVHYFNEKIVCATENDSDGLVTLENGKKLYSKLIVGADGKFSTIRKQANNGRGIDVRQWDYPQTAIVLNFSHTLPHHNTSVEFHTSSGPFTIVPLKNHVSSLVWVTTPQKARQIHNCKPEILEREIEEQMHSILGKTEVITSLQSFPLSFMRARKLAQGPFILVGESGHAFPPIGAQGYNLGIRDVEELARLTTGSVGDVDSLAKQYDMRRQTDVISRSCFVDMLNRSLLSNFFPVHILRSTAIMALNEITPVRKFIMRKSISP